MLLTKEVEIKWNGQNKSWLLAREYEFTSLNDIVIVKVNDLKDGSHTLVQVLCDYCQLNKVWKEWRNYLRDNVKSTVNTDCCANCQQIKTKECNLIKFGVESKTQLKETREKMKSTMMKNYGVEHNMQDPEIRKKAEITFFLNYGVTNPMQNKEIIDKSNKSKIERFGSTNVFTEEVRKKTIETNLLRYGTEWQMQNKDVMIKSKESLYRNGTAPCSKQQRYLHNLFGGELNYPVGSLSLDIAFPDDKIYIEYDGNGHDLSVKLGTIDKREFSKREIRRYMFLKSKGWKQFKIVSSCDYLPTDEILISEFRKAIEWLNLNEENHNHYIMEIGTKINDENYGLVRKIVEVS